jgi:hypothetical protein
MLTDALEIIEASGVKEEGGRVLDVLGYTSVWEGMDMDKVRISKRDIGPATEASGENVSCPSEVGPTKRSPSGPGVRRAGSDNAKNGGSEGAGLVPTSRPRALPRGGEYPCPLSYEPRNSPSFSRNDDRSSFEWALVMP